MSEILPRRSLRKEHLRKPHDKKSATAKQHGIWREKYKLKAEDTPTFDSPVKTKAPVLVSKSTEERMFVVDSGASMHKLSKKDLSSDEMDTLRRSRTTHDDSDRKLRSADKRGGTSVCSRFRSVRHSVITRAVLSLGKLCSEHGCSYERKNGETSRFTKDGKARPKDQSNSSGESETSSDPRRLDVPSMHAGSQCRQILMSRPRETVVPHTKKTR